MATSRSAARECAERLEAFCRRLEEDGLGGAVLDRRDDQYYLSGYTGSDAVLVVAAKRRRTWLITDSRYVEEAEATAPGAEVVVWKAGFGAFTGRLLRRVRLTAVGYTPHSMTAAFRDLMRENAPGVKSWQDVDSILSGLRAVKSSGEIRRMRAALACAEAAFLRARQRWRPGMTETEVKNDLEWEMRLGGAEDAAFETIVAVGANASLPHAHAGKRKITPGKMILIDFGARLDRYNSDLTRTLWAGSIPREWRRRYQAVLQAQAAGIAAIREGVDGSEVNARAVLAFREAGLDKHFTHGLGHGVGLAVHEAPRLGRGAGALARGNVVTVEPGVYFPGAGGIRVEDMAFVTADSCEILSTLPKTEEDAVF